MKGEIILSETTVDMLSVPEMEPEKILCNNCGKHLSPDKFYRRTYGGVVMTPCKACRAKQSRLYQRKECKLDAIKVINHLNSIALRYRSNSLYKMVRDNQINMKEFRAIVREVEL